jgi:hypothetical protein
MSLSVSGTELPREGRSPLLAFATQSGGHVVHAAVYDPEQQSELPAGALAEGEMFVAGTDGQPRHIGKGRVYGQITGGANAVHDDG